MFLVLVCVSGRVNRKKGEEESRNKEIEKGKQKLKVSEEDSEENVGKEDK